MNFAALRMFMETNYRIVSPIVRPINDNEACEEREGLISGPFSIYCLLQTSM